MTNAQQGNIVTRLQSIKFRKQFSSQFCIHVLFSEHLSFFLLTIHFHLFHSVTCTFHSAIFFLLAYSALSFPLTYSALCCVSTSLPFTRLVTSLSTRSFLLAIHLTHRALSFLLFFLPFIVLIACLPCTMLAHPALGFLFIIS